MKKIICLTSLTIFLVGVAFAQYPDFEIHNDLDCNIQVRLTVYDQTTGCNTSCNGAEDNGWITVTANSSHYEYISGYSANKIWGRIEVQNPDYPCTPTCHNFIEEAGTCSTRTDDGSSCNGGDIKVTWDCDNAYIEIDN